VDRFLLVHGDEPTAGRRTGELTVRAMVDEARAATDRAEFAGVQPFGVGVTSGLGRKLPAWKQAADFVFVQVSFSLDALLRWRDANPVDLPVYAGVMVLASAGMAKQLRAAIPEIEIPDSLVERVSADRNAGVEAACALIEAVRETGAFAGVHLVPVSRYRQVAARLECAP
jgi:5,10-methylenetetrahydrofolate reductase